MILYKMHSYTTFIFLFILNISCAQAKNLNLTINDNTVNIQKIINEPELDTYIRAMENGAIDNLPGNRIENFVARTPINNSETSEKTIVYLSYDDKNIYSVFLCYDTQPELIRSTFASRDGIPGDEDTVALHLITFPKSQQMSGFQTNAVGSQTDASYNLSTGWDLSSDPIWDSSAKKTSNGYVVKIKIPFSTLRFPPGDVQNWDFFVYRGIPRKNEEMYFPAYSSDIANRFVQSGKINGLEIQRQSLKTELTPFATSADSKHKTVQDNTNSGWDSSSNRNIGIDAKFILDDRIVADLTLNPDFSQVESDEPQVVTNQRFAVYFPEKRPFFIENSSYFETPLNLLFTRKIANPSAGLRTTGQVGDWSIAGMVIDDENAQGSNDDSLLYVTNIRKSLYQDSFIGAFLSNYSSSSVDSTNISLQGRARISDNWLVESQLAILDENNNQDSINGEAFYVSAKRQGEVWNYNLTGKYISDDFNSRVGFISRVGIKDISQNIAYRQLSQSDLIIAYNYQLNTNYVWNVDSQILDEHNQVNVTAELKGQTFISANIHHKNERLGASDYSLLAELTNYEQEYYKLGFESAWLQHLNFSLNYANGEAINYQPAAGQKPEVSDYEQIVSSLTYAVGPKLKLKLLYIGNTLNSKSDLEIFSSQQTRFKATYQFDSKWSLRFIVDNQKITSNQQLSALSNQDTFVADLLLKWQANPGTAMYLGYGSLQEEYYSTQSIFFTQEKEKSLYLKYSHRFNY